MKKNIVIIHYNTPRLTECLVRSINLFVKDAIIYIFDNSNKDPFTAEFDNVTVIDNTEGDVINFDEWLEGYPNRFSSGGRRNNWGSAKHCYSVEKCMELIGENFVLMDSDILLKKDISSFFQDDCIYVGETVLQPSSKIERLLPFICCINTEMCVKNGIHYFDDNYMHGLKKTMDGDRYDTGAIFVKRASEFKHVELPISEYIVHFNNASWLDSSIHKHSITEEEWLNRYKNLWAGGRNNKVIYTCITGGYDNLLEPTFISEGYDYVCFTDSVYVRDGFWDIRPLPEEVKELSQVKKQRWIKINAHKVLPEYDLSIWVDGSVTVRGDVDEIVSAMTDDCSIYVPAHPNRTCIYSEARAVISMKKDTSGNIRPQLNRYKAEGFPANYGLLQSNILIRKHNDPDCIRLMEAWSEEVMNGSHRDQLSFNYCCWKNEDIKVEYLDSKIYNSKWFLWKSLHLTNKRVISRPQIESKKLDESRKKFREIIETAKLNRVKRVKTNDVMIY